MGHAARHQDSHVGAPGAGAPAPRPPRGFAPLACAAALLATLACSRTAPQPAPSAAAARSGVTRAAAGAVCTGTSVHERHLARFPCVTCHPTGATFGFDAPYVFPGGTTTAGGTITLRTATAPTSCTVACHGPLGAPAAPVTWDTPGPLACTGCHDTGTLPATHPVVAANATRAECQACHSSEGHMSGTASIVAHAAAWSDPTSPEFHAATANRALEPCKSCHGTDLGGSGSVRGCGACHDRTTPTGTVAWKLDCVMCHGGADDQTGAPPKATWGNAADAVRVGAHRSHLAGSALAPPVACEACHVRPADALASGHVEDGVAEVTFAGLAVAKTVVAPTWDRTAATCSGTYCHGATLGGGSRTTPVWTHVGTGEAACGACHGLPPPAHPSTSTDLTTCAGCHPDTMTAAGAVVAPSAGGKHLDGIVQAAGGHTAEWMDPANAGFHARSANANLASCVGCHGATLDGGSASACSRCHGAGWQTSCTMCHGGRENATGAPPVATWGNDSPPTTANVRIGAHTTHVAGTASSTEIACSACHPARGSALDAGHANGTTEVAFAAGGTWDRATATCSTTGCHAAPMVGSNPAPVWTAVGQGQATCLSCHDPRNEWNHVWHANLGFTCGVCHVGYTPTTTVKSLHVNGRRDVTLFDGTVITTGWSSYGACTNADAGCH